MQAPGRSRLLHSSGFKVLGSGPACRQAGKSIRHGHPRTLHLWWARRSLVAELF
ncbi:MAG: DUF1156 domain-containing protein [Proteobacteria bacterium]|nr:DUF1156 domain-containing protein [Pseudomonadota bacterium]